MSKLVLETTKDKLEFIAQAVDVGYRPDVEVCLPDTQESFYINYKNEKREGCSIEHTVSAYAIRQYTDNEERIELDMDRIFE